MSKGWLTTTGVVAGLMVLGGVGLLLLYVVAPIVPTRSSELGDDQLVITAAELAVLGVYGLVVGALVLRGSFQASRGTPSGRFNFSLVWSLLAIAIFPVALIVGVQALGLPTRQASYLFPWLQLVAVLAPPLLALGLVSTIGRSAPATPALVAAPGGLAGRTSRDDPFGRGLNLLLSGPPTWRRVIGSLGWGLSGAIGISMVLELVGLVVGGLILLAILNASGQVQVVNALQDLLSGGGSCEDQRVVYGNPLIVSAMVLALGVFVPIIEETAKSLSVVLLRKRLTSPATAVLYGAAAGIGFGMIESAVYNVGDLDSWWATATVRAGTTLIHALATAIFSLGWYSLFNGGGRRGFLRYAAGGVFVHGLWNTITVGIIVVSVQRSCSVGTFALAENGDPVGYALIGSLAAVALGAGLTLYTLARRTARASGQLTTGSGQ